MGAYLCISLANRIVLSKDKIRDCKMTDSEAIDKTINAYGTTIDIYELIPDEEYVILSLKQEVLENGLLPFLADFGRRLQIECDNIALCFNGKIIMETYDTLFKYLSKCLKERYNKHAIAQALNVFITH